MKARAGFTLIEMSLVLVIIGLIVGGIFVGRDLIEIGQTRKVMSQMENIQSAVSTFRLKYNCIPGDCANAANFGLGTSGNGDYFIGGISDSTTPPMGGCIDYAGHCLTASSNWGGFGASIIERSFGETQYFWVHLGAAGFIPKTYSELAFVNTNLSAVIDSYFPRDALGKYNLITTMWNGKLYIRTGVTSTDGSTRPQFENALLNASQMYYLTSKYGYPVLVGTNNGYPFALEAGQKVIPIGINVSTASWSRYPYVAPNVASPAAQFNACAASDGAGGYRYNIANNGNCNMMWQIDF